MRLKTICANGDNQLFLIHLKILLQSMENRVIFIKIPFTNCGRHYVKEQQ